jgi:hypothetical protein
MDLLFSLYWEEWKHNNWSGALCGPTVTEFPSLVCRFSAFYQYMGLREQEDDNGTSTHIRNLHPWSLYLCHYDHGQRFDGHTDFAQLWALSICDSELLGHVMTLEHATHLRKTPQCLTHYIVYKERFCLAPRAPKHIHKFEHYQVITSKPAGNHTIQGKHSTSIPSSQPRGHLTSCPSYCHTPPSGTPETSLTQLRLIVTSTRKYGRSTSDL